ncbi:Peptidyl-prolyl cis-trans isomerase H [Pseudogymnoascus verrucosus]|uniref:Peptidyl-prolyl cis-trans isomerase H n=1 Tax=Pseudogymnoascus verrucosus TaxID=342668 RepID=A0A1B8GPV8_9PEZI|nr:Peptidyl-prolyl cis-trans isomerase H [Pseudogymnoascus verrucosus]OBT97875.1 Peptidyl-prolyl cis-trans isomerase H [Pseudogymnoascus verrucosus]
MPTVLPPSGNPLVFLDITIGGQPLTRLPLELYPTPTSPPFHLQCVSAPPGYKNSRITRIMPGIGIYGGSDSAAPAHAPQQFAGPGTTGRVLEEGELAWAGAGGPGGGRGGGGEGNAYVISLGGARGEPIGRVFGEGGLEGLRMLGRTGVGRRGEGVPDLEVGVAMCGEL